MTTAFRLVPRGLNLVTAGTLVLVLLWLCMIASAFDVVIFPYSARHVVLAILAVALGLAFAGRCCCLTLPPDARAARSWGVLAVILDGCGLLGGVAEFALAQSGVWVGTEFSIAAVVFVLGGFVLARVAYLFYLRSLAKHLADRRLAVRALTVFLHAVGVAGGIVLGTWRLSYMGPDRQQTQAWLALVILAILHWTWRYLRLLAAVKAAVRDYQPPRPDPADDPDREYLERYEQA